MAELKFTSELVDKLADVLMIGLTPEENKMVLDEFDTIDANINKINAIEGISSVAPMTHALDDFECEMREDIPEESIPVDKLLQNADGVDGSEVEVPKVVE